MKPSDQPCHLHRQDVSLLAAGALSRAERNALEQHLSTCPACREYLAQIQAVTTPLITWEKSLPPMEPSQTIQQRWATAIRTAARPAPVQETYKISSLLQLLWQKLILPNHRIWAGLTAAWLVLIAINASQRGSSPAAGQLITTAAMASYGEQQKLLKELFADRATSIDADQPKKYSPKPRTEKNESLTA